MQIQKWLSLLGLFIVPFLLFGCVTVANENYVRVGFIDVEENQVEFALDNPDAVYKVKYTIVPANATNQAVKFESENPSTVEVDSDGVIRAVGVGSTTVKIISVADNKVTTDVRVRVAPTKKTLAAPTGLEFNGASGELVWNEVKVDKDSEDYVRPNYQLEITSIALDDYLSLTGDELTNAAKTTSASTYNLRYSNFVANTIYTVRIMTVGNNRSYINSELSDSYTFIKLSDPTSLELVRLSNYGVVTEGHCEAGDEYNNAFKVRFEINPLLLEYLLNETTNTNNNEGTGGESQEQTNTEEPATEPDNTPAEPQDETQPEAETVNYEVSSFYSLSVINANNNVADSSDSLASEWRQIFESGACVQFCEEDGKYYACFPVPNGLVNLEYKLKVNLKSEILLSSGIHLFSMNNANTIKVSQLKAPTDLVLRSVSGDEQLSWSSVPYAAGYVLQFIYVFNEGGPTVEKTYTISNESPNRNEIKFEDIKAETGATVIYDEYYSREIYIYTLAHDLPYGGVSYTDSAVSTTPALVQLAGVTGIRYTRDEAGGKGTVSWNKGEVDNCHYQVYISQNNNAVISPQDSLVLSGDGLLDGLDENRRGVVILNTNKAWKDGENYLKFVVLPKNVDFGTSNNKYTASEVVVSGGFYKINKVENYRYEAPILTLGGSELNRSVNMLKWTWQNVIAGDTYSDIYFQIQFKVGEMVIENGVINIPQLTGVTEYEYDLNSVSCPLNLMENNVYKNYSIVIKVISQIQNGAVIPDDAQLVNLIDSVESSLAFERYSKPEVSSGSTGVLSARISHNRKVAGEGGATIVDYVLNLNTYEVRVKVGEIYSSPILFQNIDSLGNVIEKFIKEYNASHVDELKNKLTIQIRAVSLSVEDIRIDQYYLSDSDVKVYFLDGNWSDEVKIYKLDAPVSSSLSVRDGVLTWTPFTSTEIKKNVCYKVEIFDAEDQLIVAATTFEPTYEVTNAISEGAKATVSTILNDSDNSIELSSIKYFIINSERSDAINISQCEKLILSVDATQNILTWQHIDGIDTYILKVKQGNTFYGEPIILVVGNDISLDTGTFTVSYDLSLWAQNAGTYTFFVYAQGNDSLLNGVACDGKELVKLSAPTLRVGNGILSWNEVQYELGGDLKVVDSYTLEIELLSGENAGTRYYKTIINDNSTALDDLAASVGSDSFRVSICSEAPVGATLNIITSVYSELKVEISGTYYSASVYKWIDINASSVQINYDSVTWEYDDTAYTALGAKLSQCKVSLTIAEAPYDDEQSSIITVDKVGGRFTLDLSKYKNPGHYEVRIQPLGYDKNKGTAMVLNGQMSRAFTFERLPTPQGLVISRISNEPSIEWEKVSYSRSIVSGFNPDLLGDYNIIIDKKLDNGTSQRYVFSNIMAKDAEDTSVDYLATSSVGGKTIYKITLIDLQTLYDGVVSIDLSYGEFGVYVQSVAKTDAVLTDEATNLGITLTENDLASITILDSMLTSFTSLFVFSAPNVNVVNETGYLNIDKSFQKSNTINLRFTPVISDIGLSYGTSQVITIDDFYGWSMEYDVALVETSMKNTSGYVGFVLEVMAVGNSSNYVSSAYKSTGRFYQRLDTIKYKYTSAASDNVWYVELGTLKWDKVVGASQYEIKATSVEDNKVSTFIVEANIDLVQSKELKDMYAGRYTIQFKSYGSDNRDAASKSEIAGDLYYNAYLASGYSIEREVEKLTSPGYARILTEDRYGELKGEFDFGERDASGYMNLGNASAFVVKYQAAGETLFNTWSIDSTNRNAYFIASEILGTREETEYDLTLYARGNTPANNSEKCYITSNPSSVFTIYLPGRLADIGFSTKDGNLQWKVLKLNATSNYNVQLKYNSNYLRTDDTTLKLNQDDGIYSYNFDGIDSVKGEVTSVKIRYSGEELDYDPVDRHSRGVVNSIWSNVIQVYKLKDFEGNSELENTKLWSSVESEGKLQWKFGDTDYRNATITVGEEKFKNLTTELYDLDTESVSTKIMVYIQNMNQTSSQYKSGAYVLNSDIASQMFYKVDNITDFRTIADCRIGWELSDAEVDGGEAKVIPLSLLIYYLDSSEVRHTHTIAISDNKNSSVGMWEVGNFTNIYARAIGVVRDVETDEIIGMTLASNKKMAENSTQLQFDKFASGSGTQADPYIIDGTNESMIEQLKLVRYLSDMYFKLNNDVTLPDVASGNNYPNPENLSLANYAGVEFDKLVFTGGFDGGNHTISNIISKGETSFGWWNNIVTSTKKSSYSGSLSSTFYGLNGIIHNLTLEASYLDISKLENESMSGLLSKMNQGYILNCVATAVLDEITDKPSNVIEGKISLSSEQKLYIGGLVGVNRSKLIYDEFLGKDNVQYDAVIQGCVNNLPIEISYNTTLTVSIETSVGGIVGFVESGYILRCVNDANIASIYAGGIAGKVDGKLRNGVAMEGVVNYDKGAYISGCENKGEITSVIYRISNSTGWHGVSGGIVAVMEYGEVVASVNRGKVFNASNIEEGKVSYVVGGIVGEIKSSIVATSVQLYDYGTLPAADSSNANAYIWAVGSLQDNSLVIYCAWTTNGGLIASTGWTDCMDISSQTNVNLSKISSATSSWSIADLDGFVAYVEKTNDTDIVAIR